VRFGFVEDIKTSVYVIHEWEGHDVASDCSEWQSRLIVSRKLRTRASEQDAFDMKRNNQGNNSFASIEERDVQYMWKVYS